MNALRFVDISQWQPINIDWHAYRKWAAQWDGIARVSLRASYGVGYTDDHYRAYREGAIAAGVNVIIHYHYAYPQFNSPEAEADWHRNVVGDLASRPQDVLMLDMEENTPAANADWTLKFLRRQEANYKGRLPTIYASDNFVRTRLQDTRLAKYPLTLAKWAFTPDERPPCPPPWKEYVYLQYTDRATAIPGFPPGTAVDADIYLGHSGGNVTDYPKK